MYQILVVEDSVSIYEELAAILRDEGFGVTVTDTQRSAIAALEKEDADFDLALVDLALPDGNGTIVYRVAEEYDVPVIFLTAYDDEYTVSDGLDMGAADYITKPYRRRELLSRINRVLRERGKMNAEIIFGDLRVDTAKGNVYKNGEEIFLSRLEYKLLLKLDVSANTVLWAMIPTIVICIGISEQRRHRPGLHPSGGPGAGRHREGKKRPRRRSGVHLAADQNERIENISMNTTAGCVSAQQCGYFFIS